MTTQSLEEKFAGEPNLVDALRNSPTGFYVFPVPDEHTNWRDEQLAWSRSAVLFEQSFHMLDVYVSGPDKIRLLSDISINNYSNFAPMTAAQFVACNSDGDLVGDAIAFHLPDGTVNVVGKPAAGNRVCFVAETGDYDVNIVRDERTPDGDDGRLTYRFQLQGPAAFSILEKLNGGPLPETRFFGMCEFDIAGHKVTALRHGMAGAPGMEFWGPFEQRDVILAALLEAGESFDMKRGGGRTYSTAGPYSGWVGSVMPAIYTGEEMKPFREWLPAHGFEGMLSIGGSFIGESVQDYYLDPWDIGYHRLIHWEGDFTGREALLKKKNQPHRRKVWLRWHPDDVLKVHNSWLRPGDRHKYLEWPAAHYATIPYDAVSRNGMQIGLSVYAAYTANADSWFSIGILEESAADYGDEVSILWGEPEGKTGKLTVEAHVQTEIRATICKTANG